jgi:site-specific recombinase XerD
VRARRSKALVVTTPITIARSEPTRCTVADLVPPFLKWLEFVRERSPHTVAAYGFDLQAFLEFSRRASLVYPDDVSVQAVEVFIAWLRQERRGSAATANRHLQALRTFYRFAIRERQAVTNPAAEAFLLKTERKLPRYLAIAEQERLLAALAAEQTLDGRRDYALVALMLFTGLRVSEVVRLELAHVDLDAGVLRVVRGKGGKHRELPIIPRLATILRDYLAHVRPAMVGRPQGSIHPPVPRHKGHRWAVYISGKWAGSFSSEQEARAWLAEHAPAPSALIATPYFFVHGRPSWRIKNAGRPLLSRTVHAIMERGRVTRILGYKIHPHALRHSFASRARENDGDLQDIQEFMGHASISTTAIYAHLTTRKRNAKLEKLLS